MQQKSGDDSPAQAELLLVEDDSDILDLLAMGVANDGFHVSMARNGDEAIKMIADNCPDILITDFHLPGKDGLDICLALQEQRPGGLTPALIISGGSAAHDRLAEALKIPGVMMCQKPIRITSLSPLLHALRDYWLSEPAQSEGEAVEAAHIVEDETRTFPGEDLTSRDPNTIDRWTRVYTELLAYKEFMIAQATGALLQVDAIARTELEKTDLAFLRREEEHFRRRLSFWRNAHASGNDL